VIKKSYIKRVFFWIGFVILIWLAASMGIYATGAYALSAQFLKKASEQAGLKKPRYVIVNPLASQFRISGGSGSAELGFWLVGTNAHAYVNLKKRLGEWCITEAALDSIRPVVPPCPFELGQP